MLARCPEIHRCGDPAPSASWGWWRREKWLLPEAGLCSQAWPPVGRGTSAHTHTLDGLERHRPRPLRTVWTLRCTAGLHAFIGGRGWLWPQLMRRIRVPVPGRHISAFCFFQAGEKHYHPLCALCVRCGRMFAEGEEMYLQGKKRSVPPGTRGHQTGARGSTPCSRCAGGSVSFRVSGPAGSPHRAPIQEQDPGLVDVWVPVVCGLWSLQSLS